MIEKRKNNAALGRRGKGRRWSHTFSHFCKITRVILFLTLYFTSKYFCGIKNNHLALQGFVYIGKIRIIECQGQMRIFAKNSNFLLRFLFIFLTMTRRIRFAPLTHSHCGWILIDDLLRKKTASYG